MNRVEFTDLLVKLSISKMNPITDSVSKVYFEELGKLEGIEQVLKKATKREYKRGFPTVSELYSDWKCHCNANISQVLSIGESERIDIKDPTIQKRFDLLKMAMTKQISFEESFSMLKELEKKSNVG